MLQSALVGTLVSHIFAHPPRQAVISRASPACRKHWSARKWWSRTRGPIRAHGARNDQAPRARGGGRSLRICPGTWHSSDRRNCRDGIAPSRSPALPAHARQSIPAPDTCNTRRDWASPGGGWKNPRPSRRAALMFCVTVSQYHGVLASVMAQRPGPNLKSGSQTSVRMRRIFMLSSVMKKLLFHSIGALNFPS